jgi:hypothetical protein
MENVRKLALYLVLAFAGIGGLVTVNQTLADHSGLFGLAFTAAWLFPMVIGCWLAWRRPMIAFPLLMIWSMSVLGLLLWQALAPSWWNTILDSNGPIITTAMFALTAPLAIYGYQRRTRFVALILIGLSVLNIMATSNTEASERSEFGITIPVLVAGVLFMIASFVDKRDDSTEEK